jgi:hypothetical protein
MLCLGLIGLTGTASVFTTGSSDRSHLAVEARTIGAEATGHLLYYKHGTDMALLAERIAAMPEDLRGPAFAGVGFSLAYHFPQSEPLDHFVGLLTQVPAALRADAVRGIRTALGPGMAQVRPLASSPRTLAMLSAANSLDPPKPTP